MRLGVKEHGQALIETAITLPVIFTLLLGYLAVLIRIESQVELDTATSLAAAACASAPAGSTTCHDWAQATFQGTLQQYPYITGPGGAGQPVLSGCQTEQTRLQCTARAELDYSKTPMAYVIFFPVPIDSSASAFGSPYRSQ
jgi:Flp pilus assembly protein TadG